MRLFLSALLILAPLPALAQSDAPPSLDANGRPRQPAATIVVEPVAMMIAGFDANGDARVTRAEFDAGIEHSFATVDPDRRGSIGYIGFSDWALTWLGDRNALPSPFEVDQNGDNRITLDELAGRFALYFTRFDADKDGVIARSDLVMLRTPAFDPDGDGGRGKRGRRH